MSAALALALALQGPPAVVAAGAAEPVPRDRSPVAAEPVPQGRSPVGAAAEPVPQGRSPGAAAPVPQDRSPVAAEPVPQGRSSVGAAAEPVPQDSSPAVGAAAEPVPQDRSQRRCAGRVRFAEAAPYDVIGGGSRRGRWAGHAYGGWPWVGVRAQVGVGPRALAVGADVEAARFQRLRAAVLVALRWVDRPRVRLTGETLLGYVVQGGVLDQRGPNLELRVRLALPSGRVAPYVTLATAHTLLTDRLVIETARGETRDLSFRHVWTPRAALGLAVAITRSIGLEAGVDLFWADAPARTPSLPGIHAGLLFGGGGR
ncbi:MAG: hypothetical protein JNL82_06835 [Myxococcales bacterium]|nr:hypothetical protein [Myxococcales bacterium]